MALSGSAIDVNIDRYHSDHLATNFIVLLVIAQCQFSGNMPATVSSSQLQTGVVSTSEEFNISIHPKYGFNTLLSSVKME